MSAIVYHCGQGVHVGTVANLSEDVLANNDEGDTSRTHILLCTAIDDTILRDINRTAHDIR